MNSTAVIMDGLSFEIARLGRRGPSPATACGSPNWKSLASAGGAPAPRRPAARPTRVILPPERSWATSFRSGPVDYLGMVKEPAPALGRGEPHAAKFPHLRRVISAGDEPRAETLHWTAAQAAGAGVDEAALRARAAAVDPDREEALRRIPPA